MGYQEEKQRQLDIRYLKMATVWAENSYCVRRQVGALIVKNKMIISDGYNGTPSGFENVCEDEAGRTKPYVLHAEANAITKVAKSSNSSEGDALRHLIALHRVRETDHSERHPPRRVLRRLSQQRRHRAAAPRRHRGGESNPSPGPLTCPGEKDRTEKP